MSTKADNPTTQQSWKPGDKFRLAGFKAVWKVVEVVSRGLVAESDSYGHRRLIEWNELNGSTLR